MKYRGSSRKGSLLWFIPRENFRLVSGEPETYATLPVTNFDGRSL